MYVGRRRWLAHPLPANILRLISCCSAVRADKIFTAEGRAFYFYNITMSSPDARAFCRSMGHDLPSIQYAAQNQAFAQALSAGATAWFAVHIGAIDQAQEGIFTWSDGSAWSYSNWMSPWEPNDYGGNEDCAEMYLGPGPESGKWNDIFCLTGRWVVCAAGGRTGFARQADRAVGPGQPCLQ